jgi:hypothetical protein
MRAGSRDCGLAIILAAANATVAASSLPARTGFEFGDLARPILELGVCGVLADAAYGPAHDLCAAARDARRNQGVHRCQIGRT